MLITLCYVYLWLRFHRCYTRVIRSALHRHSAHSSFTFCTLDTHQHTHQHTLDTHQHTHQYTQQHTHQHTLDTQQHTLLLQRGNKGIYISNPQACDDLSHWTLLLGSSLLCAPRIENVAFIIEARSRQKVSVPRPQKKGLQWSDYCRPLAHSPGQTYRAVAEASLENFSRLGAAFLEDRLQMENGLIPEKIVSVLLRESALTELLNRQQTDSGRKTEDEHLSQTAAITLSQSDPSQRETPDARRSSLPTQSREARPEASQLQESEHQHMDGHHLHLSSCHECLELENSTILSVKFASVENIPDLPDDCAAGDREESGSGRGRRANISGKPPNVLVFTGGCVEQFHRIRSLLSECIHADSYAIYPLRPQQVLSEPWAENTLLLVLATDQSLTPQLQLRFLSYLSQGGKVLGLSSTLCPAGLALRPVDAQKDRICTLTFTRSDSTELRLSALSSGSVYARELHDSCGGEVELWGEIAGPEEKHMAIVRVTHGADSGEAVLCQVRLEVSPDDHLSQGSSGFSELKMSNSRRYEVLTEILTSLGLNCELTQMPPHSPVYLLNTHQEQHVRFLRWFRGQVEQMGGVLQTQTGRFRVFWAGEEACDLSEGEGELHTDPPENFSEHFSLQTYRQNLQTQRLGHTVLYADVTSSTMDLLESLMLRSPQEMGLIAIAARQTQGKGRGGNAWLSPLGCAMFTVHLQVPLHSRLGQRISFLQHLVALAVVESVRTLPGYEDIDLRLKWPNDIYYSNLMKLGGVLVNSSITGQTFNLLIGCGFNVSNSNPTVCINDLLLQHNRQHGRSLEPLSPPQLIARSLTLLETFICDFQLRGPQALLPLYYRRWVHGGTSVRLWSDEGPEGQVVGLDENGFLQVTSGDQSVVSVQPDGNSFDMLRNLLVTKSS